MPWLLKSVRGGGTGRCDSRNQRPARAFGQPSGSDWGAQSLLFRRDVAAPCRVPLCWFVDFLPICKSRFPPIPSIC